MDEQISGDTEEDYGLIRPSLIKSLRSILDQYPDDGQILKELLQNAEDAGARTAQFMFDGHSYGTSSLHLETMGQFQGPGLFAFNDALFNEKDWQGIRMLQDSIKEKDPMKVGRFGLGFKSVLHLTDMPSVISGDRIYMIDPHEKYFMFQEQRTTGKRWLLKEHRNQIANLQDQFAPYRNKFHCTDKAFSDGFYKGTMFRFPLRRTESALSDTLYDEKRITELFKGFETDAHMVLLFLKNLECVELLIRTQGDKEPEVKFRVAISKKYEDSLEKRREFAMRMKEASLGKSNHLSVTYPLEIETISFEDGMEKSKKTYSWLINEYYGGSQVSTTLKKLQSDPSLSYIPVVGTAMPLQQTHSTDVSKGQSEESPNKKQKLALEDGSNKAIGQIFCFLPLPIEQKSSTGLPVHVNGYFSVSQNRRHLKWPTTSQDYKTDKALMWNHCLLSELVPKSYSDLILQAVASNSAKEGIVLVSDVELALPNILQVDEKWQVVLTAVFQKLFKHKIFHSQVKKGKWLKPAKCIFDCLKEEPAIKEVVWEVMLAADMPVVSIPQHILMAMGAYWGEDIQQISPDTVREALIKSKSSYTSLPTDKKLLLLKYILKDDNFRDLDGIQLLPLASGEFAAYSYKGGEEPVFICTADCSPQLLPGLEHMLLKGDLEEYIMKKLTKLAQKRLSQLMMLDAAIIVSLLQRILPKNKEPGAATLTLDETSKLTPKWLETLWNFLRKHYPGDLGLLTGLPVLPLNRNLPLTLVPIMMPSSVVCRSAMGAELPADMCQMLMEIGVHVIDELPEYVQNHAAVIGNYVRLPLPPDVVDCMKVVCCEKSDTSMHDLFAKFTVEKRDSLVSFLSRISSREMTDDLIGFLRQVPLFECTNETRQLVSVEMVDRAAPNYSIPVFLDQDYLKLPSEEYIKVAKLLGVNVMTNATLLSQVLLPKVKSRSFDNEQIQAIMEHIFADIHVYLKEDPNLYKKLADIPFVTTESGNIDKPSALFDPDIEVLCHLFAYENRFPSQNYAEKERLQLLRKMGLQTALDVTGKDLLYCAHSIDEATEGTSDVEVLEKKSMALVKFLSHKPEQLAAHVNGLKLKDWLKGMTWVPVLLTRPVSYPQTLAWKGEQLEMPFAKPEDVVDMTSSSLVGSQKLVLSKSVSEAVGKAFEWDVKPNIENVIGHMTEVVQKYEAQDKAGYLTMITNIYRYLQQVDSTELLICLQETNTEEWVWQGDGFTSVEKIFPKRQFIDLSPYVFSVPTEMKEFVDLFTSCGMEEVCPRNMLAAILEEVQRKYEDTEGIEAEEVNRDLMLVVDVLNHMKTLRRNPDEVILMPTQSSTEDRLCLLPSSELTYCDTEWLRQGMDVVAFDEQDGILFIHDNVPVSTAEALHVPTLMSRMLHAEELEITGFGQSQPLTDRLRQLLEDYTDGLAIPKELIQNADDAHATVVKFLYDQRSNKDHQQFLIDVGMRGCQGPALWAYNNAVFTDADFANLVKLGGATKESQIDKIGKFGLGFNAVYNVTDVPSFVSRNNIVILDPHTKHLGRSIKDRSKPGIKIDMQKNKTLMRKLSDQFKPYEDVFSCEIGAETEGYFDGTLFRLPLRTQQQAACSEISPIHYNHQEVMRLLEMTIKQSHNLLLFTQNVVKVEFYHLEDGKDPTEAELLFRVEKEPVKIIRQLKNKLPNLPKNADVTDGQLELIQSSNYLSAISDFMKTSQMSKNRRSMQIPQVPQSSMAIKVVPELTDLGEKLINIKTRPEPTFWLVSACMGQEKALKFSQSHKQGEYLPVGGVAMALNPVGEGGSFFVPKMGHRGVAFCFLPLPVPTECTVHFNGSFAIQSSRKCLAEKTEDDKHNESFHWNQLLVEDAVMHAFIQLLADIKPVLPADGNVNLYETWPVHCAKSFRPLAYSFIKCITSMPNLEVMYKEGKPIEFHRVVFLDPDFRQREKIKRAALKVFSSVVQDQEMISMPDSILTRFKEAGCEEFVNLKIMIVAQFYEHIFFPNIASFDVETRDILLIFAINREKKDLNPLLKGNECIPVSPDGQRFRRPAELIYPRGMAAKLYTPEDGRFPVGGVAEGTTLRLLELLGMKVNDVDWEHLIERAQSVADLYTVDPQMGRERVQNIWNAIDVKVNRGPGITQQQQKAMQDEIQMMAATFKTIAFLPTQKPPHGFPVDWKGFDKDSPDSWKPSILSSEELYPYDMRYLVSATQSMVDDKDMTYRVKKFLGLDKKEALLPQVVTQAHHAMQVDPSSIKNTWHFEQFECIFSNIYGFLQEACKKDETLVSILQPAFQDQKCLLINGTLVEPKKVSFMANVNCAPYLFSLPPDYQRKFEGFMKDMGVRDRFEVEDYMLALQGMHEEYNERKMDEKNVGKSVMLARFLNEEMEKTQLGRDEVEEKYGSIYVPNDNGMLQHASALCFNDCTWLTNTETMRFAHPKLALSESARLGVRTKKQEVLKKYTQGISFGQKHDLVDGIHQLLRNYPLDHEILKEMIQNADDAGASHVHFVVDFNHYKHDSVFDESWKPLQGPALLVYNNKPFTMNDLESVQMFGQGSKAHDPVKTGQYGLGFSSVYHLTDVPCILTAGPEVGTTLCVFDPLCSHVPEATPAEPGTRYVDIEDLQKQFGDVFTCFHMDKFSIEEATLFRFPLRTSKTSKISSQVISPEYVKRLLCHLKEELFDILLFTNNVTNIKLSVMRQPGQMETWYETKSTMKQKDHLLRQELVEATLKARDVLRRPNFSLTDIPPTNRVFIKHISDTENVTEVWSISQSVGIPEDTTVPESVQEAFTTGNMVLLPRGGVAYMLQKNKGNSLLATPRARKICCVLPLPVITELNVHVNGHFALSSHNRRQLATEEENNVSSCWNILLFERVIAPAFVKLLEKHRAHAFRQSGQIEDDSSVFTMQKYMLECCLNVYQKAFPNFLPKEPQLDPLVMSVYTTIGDQHAPVLPCVKEVMSDADDMGEAAATAGTAVAVTETSEKKSWQISWLPPAGTGSKKAFFISKEQERRLGNQDTSSTENAASAGTSFFGPILNYLKGGSKSKDKPTQPAKRTLKDVLLSCGFKVLDVGQTITQNFMESGVEIDFMSPEGVVKFFKTYTLEDPACDLNVLPCVIEDTPFKDAETLVDVVTYCKEAATEDFVQHLEGLPFLLTNDGILRVFGSVEDQVFTNEYCDLFKSSGERFLHKLLYKNLANDIIPGESNFFLDLEIPDLEFMLRLELPTVMYYDMEDMVDWDPRSRSTPLQRDWLNLLWQLLVQNTNRFLQKTNPEANYDPEKNRIEEIRADEIAREILAPLEKWAIIPVYYKERLFLTSGEQAFRVLNCYSSEDTTLTNVFKGLGLPQLDVKNLDGAAEIRLAQRLIATIDKPDSVLRLLYDLVLRDQLKAKSEKVSHQILKYFCDNLSEIEIDEDNIDKLRALPFYKTVYKDIIALTDCQVYTIPPEIPTDGIDAWRSKTGLVFLNRVEALKNLYDFIDCANISAEEVYCQFIFQHLELFTPEQRMIHLHHVYRKYVSEEGSRGVDIEEKERVMDILRGVPIIEDEDGELQPASEFYDPENRLFEIIVPKAKFPPRVESSCFRESEWYTFLRNLGLVKEVTEDMFLEYTTAVAIEGKDPSSASAELKSKALCHHMFQMETEDRDAIMQKISDVPFVAPAKVPATLSDLCLQHGDCGNGLIPYMSFKEGVSASLQRVCWTSANILPRWADPLMRLELRGQETQVCSNLGISERPRIEVVISHIRNLCEMEHVEEPNLAKTRMEVFQRIYQFLQEILEKGEDDSEILIRELSRLPCIVVEGGRFLVKPEQTVFNIYDGIKYYLYKVPLELGDVQTLFKAIGSTDRATGKQYASVLLKLHQENGSRSLNPNDTRIALKATKGYFDAIEEQPHCKEKVTLFLPNELKVLQNSCQLVLNNSPYYYERVKGYRINFMVDLSQCGIKKKNVDELVDMMHSDQKPRLLSDLMKEKLNKTMESCAARDGTAAKLESRIKSPEFQTAVARLIKHGIYKAGTKFIEEEMLTTIDRLTNIRIFNVPEVRTHLFFETKEIKGSSLVKKCFATTADKGLGEKLWIVYIEKDAELDQELLIPLVEVINTILSGMLRDSVLYLLPLLSCSEQRMDQMLDSLNIKVDVDTVAMRQEALLPQIGAEVSEEDARKLKGGCQQFEEEEYVGFQSTEENPVIYAKVLQRDTKRAYVILTDTGPIHTTTGQLYRFVRK